MAPTNTPKKKSSGGKPTSTVSYKDAIKAGAVCGIVTLVLALIVTRAWQDERAFGYAFIYGAAAFVIVSGFASFLNWVMRKDTQNKDQSFPILK
jgi:phosphatidylglycerophosphate synthase